MDGKPFPKFLTPDLNALIPQALEAQPFKPLTMDKWQPLGPVADTSALTFGAPAWTFRTNPANNGILIQSIIEFPEFAKFIGTP